MVKGARIFFFLNEVISNNCCYHKMIKFKNELQYIIDIAWRDCDMLFGLCIHSKTS